MARYRDVTTVKFDTTTLLGVQSAEVTFSGDVLEGTGDDATSLRYAGITGVSAEMTVETMDFSAPVGLGTLRVAKRGAIEWSAPGANPSQTGVSVAVSGADGGAVCTSIGVSVGHATLGTVSYGFTIVSSEGKGNKSPFTIGNSTPATAPGATGGKGNTSLAPSKFARDIESITVAGQELSKANVLSMELTWEGTIIGPDSSDKDFWRTYVGVGKTNVRGTATVRDIRKILEIDQNTFGPLGKRGSTTFNAVLGTDQSCRPGSSKQIKVDRANISGVRASATHGDLAEGSIDFIAIGDNNEVARILFS